MRRRVIFVVAIALALPLAAGSSGARPSALVTVSHWDSRAPLLSIPAYRTAAPLRGGTQALVLGEARNAQRYDLSTNTWTATQRRNFSISEPTLVALRDGRVLVVGSRGTQEGMDAEVYDPATDRWTLTGPVPVPAERGVGLTLLSDGRVLLAGGRAPANETAGSSTLTWYYLRQTLIYDPSTNGWTAAAQGPAVAYASVTALRGGKVLVAGGCVNRTYDPDDPCVRATTLSYLYDPKVDAWASTGQMRAEMWDHGATLLRDGRVLTVSGRTNVYDPATGTWKLVGSNCCDGLGRTPTLMPTGKVLVIGWHNDVGAAALFDPYKDSWTQTSSLPEGHDSPAVTMLANGKVLAAGGFRGNHQWVGETALFTAAGPVLKDLSTVVVSNGLDVRLNISEPATVTVALTRVPSGGQISLVRNAFSLDRAGTSRITVPVRSLSPGGYRLSATPKGRTGSIGAAVRTAFVVPPRH